MAQAYPFAPPLLDVRNLSVRFDKTVAVDRVSFQLVPGEIFALVGESGSGKSTIGLSIPRLLPETAQVSGQILLRGEDVFRLSPQQLGLRRGTDIAMIFQDPAGTLNPLMMVGDQISESLRYHLHLSHRAAWARAVELLDQVQIAEPARVARCYPHELSGGMKQRAVIAMAVACGPKILVADEPTTALDASARRTVLELLHRLRKDLSLGILLISHDLNLVEEWADRVAVLYAGRVCEEGEAEQIFRAARHPYTRGLLAASPAFSPTPHYSFGRLSEIPGNPPHGETLSGCAFASRCALMRDACHSAAPPLIATDATGLHRLACPVTLPQERRHVPTAAE